PQWVAYAWISNGSENNIYPWCPSAYLGYDRQPQSGSGQPDGSLLGPNMSDRSSGHVRHAEAPDDRVESGRCPVPVKENNREVGDLFNGKIFVLGKRVRFRQCNEQSLSKQNFTVD